MPTELLANQRQPASETPPAALPDREDELRAAARRQLTRVRRLKVNAAAWMLGTILLTTLWVVNEWRANGGFERFGNEGNPGDWSPTLWALAVGIWGLIVAIGALRVYFERPATPAEVDRALERLGTRAAAEDAPTEAALRRVVRARLEQIRRFRFHVAAWIVGMIVLTPLWALIEWQDNGGFERFGNDSRPGEWEPWILYVGGFWALVIAIRALHVYLDRPMTEAEVDHEVERLRTGG